MPSRFNLGVLHRSFLPWGLIARLFELRSIGPLPNSRHRPQAPNYCLFTLALHVASTRCTLSSLAFYRTAIPLGTSDLLLAIPHYISRSTKALLSLQDSPVKTTTRNGTSTFTGPGRITARVLEPHQTIETQCIIVDQIIKPSIDHEPDRSCYGYYLQPAECCTWPFLAQ
jgi:hypothetical protein